VEAGEAELSLRLSGALSHFWEVRGYHTEGRARLLSVLDLAGTQAYPWSRANVLWAMGCLATDQGDYAEARALHEERLAIMRELGDRLGVARGLTGLAWIATERGDYSTSRALHEESLAIMRDLGDRRYIAYGLQGLGRIAAVQGDRIAARTHYEEALAIMREVGDPRNVARLLMNLGWEAVDQEAPAGVRERLTEGLAIADELGDSRTMIDGIELSAYVARALGRMDRAARLRGAADAFRETIGLPLSPAELTLYDPAVVRAALGEPGFAAAWAEGRAMTPEQAVAYALDEPPSA
jgi:tetratricopeptide (TPR) repeat protein